MPGRTMLTRISFAALLVAVGVASASAHAEEAQTPDGASVLIGPDVRNGSFETPDLSDPDRTALDSSEAKGWRGADVRAGDGVAAPHGTQFAVVSEASGDDPGDKVFAVLRPHDIDIPVDPAATQGWASNAGAGLVLDDLNHSTDGEAGGEHVVSLDGSTAWSSVTSNLDAPSGFVRSWQDQTFIPVNAIWMRVNNDKTARRVYYSDIREKDPFEVFDSLRRNTVAEPLAS